MFAKRLETGFSNIIITMQVILYGFYSQLLLSKRIQMLFLRFHHIHFYMNLNALKTL